MALLTIITIGLIAIFIASAGYLIYRFLLSKFLFKKKEKGKLVIERTPLWTPPKFKEEVDIKKLRKRQEGAVMKSRLSKRLGRMEALEPFETKSRQEQLSEKVKNVKERDVFKRLSKKASKLTGRASKRFK